MANGVPTGFDHHPATPCRRQAERRAASSLGQPRPIGRRPGLAGHVFHTGRTALALLTGAARTLTRTHTLPLPRCGAHCGRLKILCPTTKNDYELPKKK